MKNILSLAIPHPFLTLLCVILCTCALDAKPAVIVGSDRLFSGDYDSLLKGKRVGLITNHTAVNGDLVHTADLLKSHSKDKGYQVTAFFAPEHGIKGASHAVDLVEDDQDEDGIPIYSLHGKTHRPTEEMLKKVDLLIYDMQDIGSRSYTYISTLFYAMEEAAKRKIPVVVLDRPNPINGVLVDGPMLDEKWRSIVGYINVPYCHGMTVGELAKFFNIEYNVGCSLHVVPMRGWTREMTFADTGLTWIPTSPNIPEATTVWFYPATGILGELQMVNIGVGYTLPFKLIGAPWIDADKFASQLNAQHFPGVVFTPLNYTPFFGRFAKEECRGVMIAITDRATFKPVQTEFLIIGILKSMYPEQFAAALETSKSRKDMFCKVTGTDEIFRIISEEKFIVWKLKELQKDQRAAFMHIRNKYLISAYTANEE